MHDRLTAPDPTGVLDGFSPAQRYEAPEADKRTAKRIEECFRRARDYRSEYDKNWDVYRRYLKGESLVVHKTTGELVNLTAEDSKRLRSQKNALRPTARSLVGKLTRSIPLVRVVPPSNDFNDAHGAQVADALLTHIRRAEHLDLLYQEACEFLPWGGNGFLQLEWDRLAGERRAWCDLCSYSAEAEQVGAVCPQCQMQRQEEMQLQLAQQEMLQEQAAAEAMMMAQPDPLTGEPVAEVPSVPLPPMEQLGPLPLNQEPPLLVEIMTGDVSVKCVDLRDFSVEPGASCLGKARWCGSETLLPVSTVRAQFPEMALFIDRETITDYARESYFDDYGERYGSVESFDEHVWLREFHEAPTEMYPKGRIVWEANGNILREIESPYYEALGRFPFFHWGWDHNSGEFYCEPFIEQAWHRQRELNNTETAIREHIELLLKPKFLNPLGSRITADELTASTAQVISFNSAVGMPPQFLEPPKVPTDMWQRGAQLEADIRQLAGITDADMGLTQSDPNGRAMAIIQAEADQQLGPITRRNNSEWRELHRGILILCQKFYTPDRTWAISGPDGTVAYYFHEMNLNPGWDIELEEHDGMSANPAIRFQQASDLATLGYFIDPMTGLLDKKGFARAARLHVDDRGHAMEATEKARAASIPVKIEQGVPVMPHTYDDPMIFAETLLGWLRGNAEQADPLLIQQVEFIWQFYVEWAMTGMMPGTGFPAISTPGAEGGPVAAGMLPMRTGGGPGPGGPDQSAPGGTPNNPGHMGSDRPIAAQANEQVTAADKASERMARISPRREG